MFVPGIVLTEQYQLMERCGAGGQGDVWIVKDIRTGMLRAAKISKIPYSERSETQFAQMRTAYQKETETLKALGNRHVVTIFDFFTDS